MPRRSRAETPEHLLEARVETSWRRRCPSGLEREVMWGRGALRTISVSWARGPWSARCSRRGASRDGAQVADGDRLAREVAGGCGRAAEGSEAGYHVIDQLRRAARASIRQVLHLLAPDRVGGRWRGGARRGASRGWSRSGRPRCTRRASASCPWSRGGIRHQAGMPKVGSAVRSPSRSGEAPLGSTTRSRPPQHWPRPIVAGMMNAVDAGGEREVVAHVDRRDDEPEVAGRLLTKRATRSSKIAAARRRRRRRQARSRSRGEHVHREGGVDLLGGEGCGRRLRRVLRGAWGAGGLGVEVAGHEHERAGEGEAREGRHPGDEGEERQIPAVMVTGRRRPRSWTPKAAEGSRRCG